MFSYGSLGLQLQSDVSLPALGEGSGPAVISIYSTAGALADRELEAGVDARCTITRSDEHLEVREDKEQRLFSLRYWDGTRFLVELAGDRVQLFGARPDAVSEAWYLTYLTGPVLGFCARLLGHTVLHASAVELDGRAVLLVGHGGDGKSTLAAALSKRGASVITDDLSRLLLGDEVRVAPGPRRVRLWEESGRALRGAELPRIAPDWEKRFLDDVDFVDGPRGIAGAFILTGIGHVEPLSKSNAVLALVERVFAEYLTTRAMRGRDLEVLCDLVERVPVWTLPAAAEIARADERAGRVVDQLRSAA